jgi:erythromycin esterase-like protein
LHKFTLRVFICTLACLSISASATATTVTTNLPASVYPLSGIDPKLTDDADLAPLDNIIGDAHVVALGEAMHTSGGFHDVRFRVIRHLIRDKGFRVLTLESPRLMSQPLIDFVDGCKTSDKVDDAKLTQAMDAMFPVFASETMKNMIGWVCQFNAAHPTDAVSFTGFDVQESHRPFTEIEHMLSAKNVLPSLSDAMMDISHCVYIVHSNVATIEDEHACFAVIDGELKLLSNASDIGLATNDLELVKLDLRNLRVAVERHYLQSLGDSAVLQNYQVRDEAMADTFLTMKALYWKNSRVIIWAHNRHIEREGLADASPYFGNFKDMGQFLSERLQDDYKAIGLLAFQLAINWPAIDAACATGSQARGENPAEMKLRMLDRPYLLIDTTAMRNKPAAFFSPNVKYSYSQDSNGPLTREFDGLIYLQNSHAMTTFSEAACPIIADWPVPKLREINTKQNDISAVRN